MTLRALVFALLAVLATAAGTYFVLNPRIQELNQSTAQLSSEVTATKERESQLRAQLSGLEERVLRLSANTTASGGGTNSKMMPDSSGQPTVELLEVFSFDRNHAFCRIDTNAKAFVMPTYKMGNVTIPANAFFMNMQTTSIDEFQVKTTSDGKRFATFKGNLDCTTEVSTTVRLGSRTASEPATYEIEAVDSGRGGGKAGDNFAFTVFFDEQKAPLNHSIFGPKATFTGRMVDGEITIVDPKTLQP